MNEKSTIDKLIGTIGTIIVCIAIGLFAGYQLGSAVDPEYYNQFESANRQLRAQIEQLESRLAGVLSDRDILEGLLTDSQARVGELEASVYKLRGIIDEYDRVSDLYYRIFRGEIERSLEYVEETRARLKRHIDGIAGIQGDIKDIREIIAGLEELLGTANGDSGS